MRSQRGRHNLATAAALCILVNTYIDSGSCQDSKVSLIITLFPDGSEGKASAYSLGDLGSIPRSGRSSGEGNGNPLQYSCLENPMDGEAW